MTEKIAFVCNANCQRRNNSTDEEITSVKETLTSKGFDIRTRGCLQICADIDSLGFPVAQTDIVNVELHDDNGRTKRSVAGMNGKKVGIRTVTESK